MSNKHLGQAADSEHTVALILSYFVAAILVLLPFHALLTTWAGSNSGHLDVARVWKEILILLMVPPALWLMLRSPILRTWPKRSYLPQMIMLYFLIHLALGIWGLKHHQLNSTALAYALIINLRFLGFFVICYVVAAYNGWLKAHWARLLLLPSLVVIAFGLAQKFLLPYDFLRHFGYGKSTIPAYQTVDSDLDFQRIQSTLRGANPLGAYFVLVIPALSFVRNNPWRGLGLIGSLIALYFTYSRSAWIGLFLTFATFIIWRYGGARRTKELIFGSIAVIILITLGIYILKGNHSAQDTLFHTSSSSRNISSNQQRASAIKAGLQDVLHNPVGRGPGTAGPASFRNTGHPARISEDYFLQIGQEVGIVGLVLFLIINSILAKELWLKRRDILSQVLLVSLFGISFINLVSHAWTDDTLSLLWWGLAGICLAPVYKLQKSNRNARITGTNEK